MPNLWHHLTVVGSAASITYYVDGVAVGTVSGFGSAATTLASVGNFVGGGQPYALYVDEMYYYSRALSAGEVSTAYASAFCGNPVPPTTTTPTTTTTTTTAPSTTTTTTTRTTTPTTTTRTTTTTTRAATTTTTTVTAAPTPSKCNVLQCTPTFQKPRTLPFVLNQPTMVRTGDLNNDGVLDFVVALAAENRIAAYLSNRSLAYTEITVTRSALNVRAIHVVDMDRDGILDIASASAADDKIAWYRHDGAGTFLARVASTAARGAVAVHAADVDGDGLVDLASASAADNRILLHRTLDAFGSRFSAIELTKSALGASAVVLADVTGDGLVDVVAGSASDGVVGLSQNLGGLQFAQVDISTNALGVHALHTADLDADGVVDVISATSSGLVSRYKYRAPTVPFGLPSFSERTAALVPGVFQVATHDIDLDGDLDLVMFSTSSGISWMRNDGRGVFTSWSVFALQPSVAWGVGAFADLDNDGDTDFLAVPTGNAVTWWENSCCGSGADCTVEWTVSLDSENISSSLLSVGTPSAWVRTSAGPGLFVGNSYWRSDLSRSLENFFRFSTVDFPSGDYVIWLSYAFGPDRATNVPITVTHSSATVTFELDQTRVPQDPKTLLEPWHLLPGGPYQFANGVANQGIQIGTLNTRGALSGNQGFVIVDAVREGRCLGSGRN